MSNSVRLSGLATRLSAFLLLSAAFTGFGRSAAAQTSPAPPQLLPYTVTAVAGGGTYGNSTAGWYNNGANTVCSYQSWNGTAYSAKTDSNHTPTDTVGDGCLANEVALVSPRSSVADSEGNVFFIDSGNNLIRRVDAHTGVVSTVAGITIASTSQTAPTFASIVSQTTCPVSKNAQTDAYGDGCQATEVPMASPEALALDTQGNVWFTDYYLGAVREIVKSTGIIQTVVNQSVSINPGISSNGFTWAAKTGYVGYNATNATSTYGNVGGVQGNGKTYVTAAQALLFRPYALAFDTEGNLYIADNYNNVVDVVNLSNITRTIAGYTIYPNEIFTIAGTGCPARWDTYTAGESVSSSTSPTQANMSCDSSSYYGHSNGSSPYPSTGSTIDSPYQVAVDNSGNIYFADEYPYDVRVIADSTGYTLPSGASLGVGDIGTFAGTPNTSRTVNTAVTSGVATSTALGSVYGVATDPQGNVYIADYQSSTSKNCTGGTTSPYCTSNYIERADAATGELYAIAGQMENTPTTAGIATNPANSCATTETDGVGDGCPGLSATVWKTYFPYVDASYNLYFGDAGNGLIRKLSSGTQFPATSVGNSVTQTLDVHFGVGDSPATSGAFAVPSSVADFSLGTLGTCTKNSDTSENCPLSVTFKPGSAGLRTASLTVTSTKGLVSTFALTGAGLAPVLAVDPGKQSTLASTGVTAVSGIAVDNAGNVYAAVPGNNTIAKIGYTCTSPCTPASVGSSLSNANAVAVDAAGNVYAALSTGSVIEVPANSSTVGGQITQIPLGSGFTDPAGIAVDAFGNVYVADQSAGTLTEILAGTGAQAVLSSSLTEPSGVAVDSYGNVFVASATGNSVTEIPFNGSAAVTLGAGLSAPLGLAVDPAGSLYVADSKNGRIVYIPNESGTLNSSDQIAIVTGLGTPTGVAIAADGTAYISDSNANAVYKVVRSSASIKFGSVNVGIGNVTVGSASAPADIVSMGNAPATVNSSFTTAGGANAADFTLTPSTLNSEFPNAGYGLSLTASFSPTGTATGTRNGSFTFATGTTLTVNGTATEPSETANVTVNTYPTSGSDWVYGQTPLLTIVVTSNNSAAVVTPNGTVTAVVSGTVNGTSYAATYTVPLDSTHTNYWQALGYVQPVSLGAGTYSVTVSYSGDSNFAKADNSAAPFTFTVDKAPLTVTANTISKAYGAPLPTLTGTRLGLAPGDTIQDSYTTTAVATSPVTAAGYPVVPSVTGSALNDYTVTLVNGTLNVTPEPTLAALATSATSVNGTTQVTLTATVTAQTAYPGVLTPTGYVAFYNTANGATTQIGANAQVNSSGVASLQTSFASGASTTSYAVTAVYLGDNNYQASTPSAGLTITSGTPTFVVTPPASTSVTVAAGQSGMMSFNMTPAYGYDGTITFSCTGAPASVTCSFSPASIVSNGASTPMLVALTINSQASSAQSSLKKPAGIGHAEKLPLSLAILPGLVLLAGFAGRSRKTLRKYLPLLVVALGLIGIGLSGCGGTVVPGTPSGAKTITVVATGSGGSFAGVTQQFTVTLNVQ